MCIPTSYTSRPKRLLIAHFFLSKDVLKNSFSKSWGFSFTSSMMENTKSGSLFAENPHPSVPDIEPPLV